MYLVYFDMFAMKRVLTQQPFYCFSYSFLTGRKGEILIPTVMIQKEMQLPL